MDKTDTFDEDVKRCKAKRIHLVDQISDSGLKIIDEHFADADALSRENYAKTNWHRLFLVICGILITYFFISYGEGDNNIIISGICAGIVFLLIVIKKYFDHEKSHKKHLQYRVFAESLRAQFFITYAGIDKNVGELLPWVIKSDLPWIADKLSKLPPAKTTSSEAMFLFCQNQIQYHSKVINSDGFFNRSYNFLTNMALILTVALYFAAFAFDVYLVFCAPKGLDLNDIYFKFKLLMGLMTIITLMANNFFGKMSLNVRVKEHQRRIDLYDKRSLEILANMGDNQKAEELFIDLIREFLIENSTWYVYESQNKLGFII